MSARQKIESIFHPSEVSDFANSAKALSIGIGSFGEATELKNAGLDLTLCDISPKAVEFARESGYEAFVCNITEKNQLNEKYDYIFALEVLEHLVNPLAAIENPPPWLEKPSRKN